MRQIPRRVTLTLLVAALLIPFIASVTLEHGHTTVGDYTLLIVDIVGVVLGVAGIVAGAVGLRARSAGRVVAAGQAKRTA